MSEQIILGASLANAEMGNFDAIPAGQYTIQCESAEICTTANKTGKYIKTKFRITDGKYANRYLFHNFNIQNENKKAVDIGLGQLKSFMLFGGFLPEAQAKAQLPSSLINVVVGVKTKNETSEKYGDQSRVTSFFAVTPEGLKAQAALKKVKPTSSDFSDPKGATATSPF